MRILMILVIGFAIGCGLGIWAFNGLWMLVVAGVFVVLWSLLRFIHTNRVRTIISLLFIGTAIGLCWMFGYDTFYIYGARKVDGRTEHTTIELTDYSVESYRGSAGEGKVKINGTSYKVYFYLSEDLDLYPGTKVSGNFYFRFTGFGGQDEATYHQGDGIFLVAYADDSVTYENPDKIPVRYFPAYLRAQIIQKLSYIFPEDVFGFSKALLLGDTSDLKIEDDAALKISGIRHIVAVSGLHISIMMSFVFVVSRERRFLNALIGVPLLLLFASLAGFTPSVVRACIMQILFLIALEFDSEYDAPTALAIAVLVLLIINPLVLTSVSFQLSVGCVIGILLFSTKTYHTIFRTKFGPAKGKSLKARLKRAIVQSISITIATMATTLPIVAYYFGNISLVSVITNFLTLWIISICFYGIAFSCLLGFIIPPLGVGLAWVISWPIRFVLQVAKLLSKVPFASVSVHNIYFLLWLVFLYILFAVFLFSKKKRPFTFVGLALGGLFICAICAFLEPRLDQYRVTVLDVGQGQCVLIQSKNDCYVVDCGGFSDLNAADLAAQTLRSCGIRRIDGLILTHFDYDHAGYAESFLAQINVQKIYAPDADADNDIRMSLESRYADSLDFVYDTIALDCGVGELTVYPAEIGKDGNESSLCILFQALECDILITGDRNTAGERHLVDNEQLPLVDILVVGHHGAKSSTSLYLLNTIKPQMAVISVGEDNSYGHPSDTVLKRLERIGCTVWRTDQDGTIVFRG